MVETRKLPAAAFRFAATVEIGDNGPAAASAPVHILARSGDPVITPYLDAPVVHDFAGMLHKPRLALDWMHDDDCPIGYVNKFDVATGDLFCSGAITPVRDDDKASEVLAQAKSGVPFEASVDFRGDCLIEALDDNQQVMVNNRPVVGPAYIVRRWSLRGVALCLHGVDQASYAQFAEGDTVSAQFVKYVDSGEQIMSEQAVEAENVAVETVVDTVETIVPVAEAVEETAVETQAAEGAETQEAVVDTSKAEGEKPVETSAAFTEVAPESQTLSLGERFLETFGDKGGVWFAQGKSYDEAMQLFVQHLSQENAELKRLVSLNRGASQPLTFSEGNDQSDDQRDRSEATKLYAAKGLPAHLAGLAAAMKLANKKVKKP
jgi:hypothetical protein